MVKTDKTPAQPQASDNNGDEHAPELEPKEARQSTIIFDSKKKRYRFVIFAAILLAIYGIYYLTMMR